MNQNNYNISRDMLTHAPRLFEEEVTFLFHISDRCNLDCKHCFIDAHHTVVHQFSVDEVSAIVTDMKKLKTHRICFSGGEPIMHEGLIDILTETNEIGFIPDFVSNGTLIIRDMAKKIHGLVKCVLISVDGPEEYHDTFRGQKGAFKRTMKGINNLIKEEVPFALQFTVTKKSLPFVEWIAETASGLGAISLKLEPLFAGGRAQDIAGLCLTEKEVDLLAEKTTKLYGKYLATTNIYMGIHSKKTLVEHPCNAYACFGHECHRHAKNEPRDIIILPDGGVCPVDTCLHPAYYIGNVNEKSLFELMQDYFGSPQHLRFIGLCKTVFEKRVKPYPYEAIPWSQILAEESWEAPHETQ
jgi:MoaA/NifB/PqqE/SkfB family radical SAM enzyme